LEPEAFFGRVAELQRLRHEARSLLRGRGRSRAIFGRPGSGKTELLLQWHGTLFREGEILPLYYAVGAGRDAGAVAADLARRIALQALAFAKRDPSLLLRPPSSEEVAAGLRSAFGGAGGVLSEGLLRAGGGPAALDVEGAALLPSRLSLAAGIRVICMLDDAGNLLADDRAIPLPQAAAATASAPLLLAVERESEVDALLGCGSASVASLERLAPLGTDAVRQMARSLARIAGLQLGEETISALEREAAGNPFYLAALVRTLHERGGTGPRDVARAASTPGFPAALGAQPWPLSGWTWAREHRRAPAKGACAYAWCVVRSHAMVARRPADAECSTANCGSRVPSAAVSVLDSSVSRLSFMPKRIPAAAWFPPQEPADCAVCCTACTR
jgi:hypothetical protein